MYNLLAVTLLLRSEIEHCPEKSNVNGKDSTVIKQGI